MRTRISYMTMSEVRRAVGQEHHNNAMLRRFLRARKGAKAVGTWPVWLTMRDAATWWERWEAHRDRRLVVPE